MAGIATQDTEEDLLDDRPIALRRKKRSSSSLANPENKPGQADEGSNSDDAGTEYPRTPRNPKKRVRFSVLVSNPPAPLPPGMTSGITPYFKRTTLMPKVAMSPPLKLRLPSKNPKKRASLPSSLSVPCPSLQPPPARYISGDVHFEPIRQTLDERTKRRLKRNNMSEELNDIAAERKTTAQLTKEVQDLKVELASAKQQAQEAKDSLVGEKDNGERIQELEDQIALLKHDVRERSATASYLGPTDFGPTTPISGNSNHGDDDNDLFTVNNDDIQNLDVTPSHPTAPSTMDATTQASFPPPTHVAVFQSVRMSLERLFPGEIPLGLNIEDPKPMLEIMIDQLNNMRTQIVLAQDSLSTTKNQEANLRNQFNLVLQQLERARHNADKLCDELASERVRGDKAEERIKRQEGGNQHMKDMETELNDKDKSMKKLQDALQSYRAEVKKLEDLVSTLDEEHKTSLSELRDVHIEEIADLHCELAAETTGRKAAEKSAVERKERIKELEHIERELKCTVSEKQEIIRDMEREIVQEKARQERQNGIRNVTMGNLSSNLQEAYDALARAEAEKSKLMEMLAEEIAAGTEAIGAMHATSVEAGEALQGATAMIQEEMVRFSEAFDRVRETHANGVQRRGAEVVEQRGLLTPVSACKFKDVEGHVEVKRGKAKGKRLDSSTAGLEEDDLEDIMEEDLEEDDLEDIMEEDV